ncbi:MAG: hypothetical protein MMC23_009126 [Stictis urceolatum]|nr:hypothetical protein [Stictis urceolata]
MEKYSTSNFCWALTKIIGRSRFKTLVSSISSLSEGASPSIEKTEYASLVADTGEANLSTEGVYLPTHHPAHGSGQRSRAKSWMIGISIALLSIWALVSSAAILQARLTPDPQSRSCSCGGTTVAEAKRRGCIFTPLAIAWLPRHCIDFELAREFDYAGPGPNGEWEYWAHQNRTHALTHEDIGNLADYDDGFVYMTQEWHVVHCVYTWKKHYRQKSTGISIERRSNGLDHIAHCGSVFENRAGLQAIATIAGIALDADDPGETTFEKRARLV